MRVPIIVPNVGFGDETIHLSGWFIDEGDMVFAGDLVAEVLIPGVTFDISAETAGRLVEIKKSVDTAILPGDILGWLDDADDK